MKSGMALRVALRSLALQPVRTAVLACGFGSGIAAMAGLLGVGEVILVQSRSPQLAGGGQLVVRGAAGTLGSARFVMSSVLDRAVVASPSIAQALYLVEEGEEPHLVFARGGIPSLERAIGDGETAGHGAWQDTAADRRWSAPDPADVLRSMDRFHAIPEHAQRPESWAEWLYFNGRAGEARFYLTFLVGSPAAAGMRVAGVRLQLERDGRVVQYSDRDEIDEARALDSSPDLRIGASSVTLEGLRYRIDLKLWREGAPGRLKGSEPDLSGVLTLDAVPGRSLPPFQVRGARGWLSGYTVPVLAGPLGGSLSVLGRSVSFEGGSGYHDHNWGFWDGVTWRWGQVATDDLSFVYGRILPPAAVADASRLPGLLVALGPDGPLGFATDVTIEEQERRIVVRGTSDSLDLTLELTVVGEERTQEFLQLRADYHVTGRIGDRRVDFSAPGSAETFRRAENVQQSLSR